MLPSQYKPMRLILRALLTQDDAQRLELARAQSDRASTTMHSGASLCGSAIYCELAYGADSDYSGHVLARGLTYTGSCITTSENLTSRHLGE
jgi:hypothetical protein